MHAAGYTRFCGTPRINGFVDHALWNRTRNGDSSFTVLLDIAMQTKFTGGTVKKILV